MFTMMNQRVSGPEAVCGYLEAVAWAKVDQGDVYLTNLGRSILASQGSEEEAPSPGAVDDVILEPENPLAIVELVGRLRQAGAGMIVDPFFEYDMLQAVCESTTMKRILVGARLKASRRNDIAHALGELQKSVIIPEVRVSSDRSLHDRCIISDDGKVSLIGASMNGIGRNVTSIVHPDERVQDFYRSEYEKIWGEADPIEPQAVRSQKTDPQT